MTIEKLTKAEFGHELGYVDAEGRPSERAIARILRDAMARWGLSPKRALLKYARNVLRVGDIDIGRVPAVLERLIAFGECAEVTVGHEAFIAPAECRWIAIGGNRAVLLGPLAAPSEISQITNLGQDDIAVRLALGGEETAVALDAAGIRHISLEEWIHQPGYLRHVLRREADSVRIDHWNLPRFWDSLAVEVYENGLLIDAEAEVRAVVGPPGGFFGNLTAESVEGRWRTTPPDGVWCCYRRGHGNERWLPALVSVDGDARRMLDLFDHDEWRWALLARSRALGIAEVSARADGEEHVTWPLPIQLQAAMNIIGVPAGAWRWRVAADAPDLWPLLR